MKLQMLRKLERWAISTLYDKSYINISRVNRKNKRVIFNFMGWTIMRAFGGYKEKWALIILCTIFKYQTYEVKLLLFFVKLKAMPISHTWGEIQDIIRIGRYRIPTPPLKFRA